MTSIRGVDKSDGFVHQQHQTDWKAYPVLRKLGTDYTRSMGLASHIRVSTQTPWQTKPMPKINCSTEEQEIIDQGIVGQGCNSGGNTVPREICVTKSQIFLVEKRKGDRGR